MLQSTISRRTHFSKDWSVYGTQAEGYEMILSWQIGMKHQEYEDYLREVLTSAVPPVSVDYRGQADTVFLVNFDEYP